MASLIGFLVFSACSETQFNAQQSNLRNQDTQNSTVHSSDLSSQQMVSATSGALPQSPGVNEVAGVSEAPISEAVTNATLPPVENFIQDSTQTPPVTPPSRDDAAQPTPNSRAPMNPAGTPPANQPSPPRDDATPASPDDESIVATPPNCFNQGSGTAQDPYQIFTISHLRCIDHYLDADFILMNDLDFSAQENWRPIGADETLSFANGKPFSGTFDGGGHTFRHLTLNHPNRYRVGLFQTLKGATIRHLSIDHPTVLGYGMVGVLAGLEVINDDQRPIVFDQVHINQATVKGDSSVGSLMGASYYALQVIQSKVSGEINGRNNIGMMFGVALNLTIHRSTIAGRVTGTLQYTNNHNLYTTNTMGGLAGSLGTVDCQEVQIDADVRGTERVGGVAGAMQTGIIRNTAVRGDLNGQYNVGGISGYTGDENEVTLEQSYFSGHVRAKNTAGGLWGFVSNEDLIKIRDSAVDVQFDQGRITQADTMAGAVATGKTQLVNVHWLNYGEGLACYRQPLNDPHVNTCHQHSSFAQLMTSQIFATWDSTLWATSNDALPQLKNTP